MIHTLQGWMGSAGVEISKTPEIHTEQAEHVAIAFISDNIHIFLLRQNIVVTLTSYVGHLVVMKHIYHVTILLA